MDNFALDFCVNEDKTVIPFDITVPYARDIYTTDSDESIKNSIDYQIKWFAFIGIKIDKDLFTKNILSYLLKNKKISE